VSRILIYALLIVVLTSCGRKPESVARQHHYRLTGRVIALNAKDHTANIDAAAIPHFMEAMTMEYPIKSKADFDKLHIGDQITATVNASDDGLYDLSDVQRLSKGTAR